MIYFAYGSNMSVAQMAARCPNARLLGTGTLPGVRLAFYRHATVEATGDTADSVPLAVWELDAQDEANLDAYEDYPAYYTKETWTAHMADGTPVEGMLYRMVRLERIPPDPAYVDVICSAYQDLGFSDQVAHVLAAAGAQG